jgi:hypothetical protein
MICTSHHSIEEARSLFIENPDDYDFANRALSVLNLAALYVEYGYIDEELFMLDWGFVYAGILENCQHFIAERVERNSAYPQAWSHFQFFAMQAAARDLDDYATRRPRGRRSLLIWKALHRQE